MKQSFYNYLTWSMCLNEMKYCLQMLVQQVQVQLQLQFEMGLELVVVVLLQLLSALVRVLLQLLSALVKVLLYILLLIIITFTNLSQKNPLFTFGGNEGREVFLMLVPSCSIKTWLRSWQALSDRCMQNSWEWLLAQHGRNQV